MTHSESKGKGFLLAVMLLRVLAGPAFADTIYVDAAAGGAGDGTTWAQAWNAAQFFADTPSAGDIYYVRGGTYTASGSIDMSASDGTAALPVRIIGVKVGTTAAPPTASDYAYLTDRPVFDFDNGAYGWTTGDYYVIENCSVPTDAANGMYFSSYGSTVNCKFVGVGGATDAAVRAGTGTTLISCEISGTPRGVTMYAGGLIKNCNIHDCGTGIYVASGATYDGNRISACTVGIDLNGCGSANVLENTIMTCTTAIVYGTAYGCRVINNIIDDSTTEATATSLIGFNYWNYNLTESSPVFTNVTKGANDVEINVALNADGTLQSGSAALNVGLKLTANEGISGAAYKMNIGADQDDNTAATTATKLYIFAQ